MQSPWKTVWSFLKTKIEYHMIQQFHSWIYIRRKQKTLIQKDTCILVFMAARFTIAKTWKQPRCPSTHEWMKKMWHIWMMKYYSAIKNKWNNAICSNKDGPRDDHTKWCKSDRERQISYNITYVVSKKMTQMNSFTKQKYNHRHRKEIYGYQRGKRWGRDKLGVWD